MVAGVDRTTPVRYNGIWDNLPLRAKAAACLVLPIPLLELCVIGLGFLGFHQFQVLAIPAAGLELLAFVWVLEADHRRIRQLKSATDRICQGQSWPVMAPYSWEWNAIGRNLESLVAASGQLQRENGESRDQAARLFEDTPAAYLQTDAQGVVKRANRSASSFLGRPSEEICGMRLWELFGAAGGPASQEQLLARIDRKEASEAFDAPYVGPDGVELKVGVQERLLRDAAGALTGAWYLLTDLTPGLRAAETAAHCERELRLKEDQRATALAEAAVARQAESRFLSKVSNDLRAPLHTIVGFVELMLDGKVAKAAERRECLDDILSSARELTGLVDRLLDQGKGESVNQAPARPGTFDLETLVDDLGYLMPALSPQWRGGRIQLDLDPQVRYVTADREALRQLVAGYLLYAGKMVKEDGQVVLRTVRADADGYRVEVEFSGIPSERTGDTALTGGLEHEAGLAQVRQFLENRGGHTGVQNPPGRGTVLYAVLPETHDAAHRRAAGAALPSGGETGHRPNRGAGDLESLRQTLERGGVRHDCGKPILVAGRTLAGVQALMSGLQELGHAPIWLHDLSAVLSAAESRQPAGVVVDLQNQGAADYEFVRVTLRNAGLSTPVIGFSGEVSGPESTPGPGRVPSPASPEGGRARPRLRPVPGAGRKRLA